MKQFVGRSAGMFLIAMGAAGFAQQAKLPQQAKQPWMDAKLGAEQRAEMVLREMTLEEKLSLLHGEGMRGWPKMPAAMLAEQQQSNGGAGFVLGVPRLGIPSLQMSDAAYGVRSSAENGRYSTALPSDLGSAASWDPEAACAYGALIGSELRAQGYNMSLGGGVNLAREPRNGRTFEYLGEDPVLAGTMVGQRIRCEGEQHVINDIKHYALNDQETGRTQVDARMGERGLRESDLLAFELGVETGRPKAVMCSYNGVNGEYACQNRYLLTEVLKQEWGFPGFVVSDWGGTHSTELASHAGLDHEEPLDTFYGPALKAAVASGAVSPAELDEHVRRVLYAEFASGIVDYPRQTSVVDVQKGFDTAQAIEEKSLVLLRNERQTLPLRAGLGSIAVIGKNADTGMISGGGSAQVDPPGTVAGRAWRRQVWFPSSPLRAIRAQAGEATVVSFASGEDVAAAVAAAKAAEVAVVFAWQWEAEDADLPNLSLPGDQDRLIAAVAAANPHTVVVLETGTAVTMPWLAQTAAVVEAWYGGSKGADAVARVLFGAVNPSGKLPLTFPVSESELPRPTMAAAPLKGQEIPPAGKLSFQVEYAEGARVGYKFYETERRPVLFPFGFGLSYTSFAYSGGAVAADGGTVTFTVKNTGARAGAEVAEVYARLPASAGEPWKRLVGWRRVWLAPGESQRVSVAVEAKAVSIWDVAGRRWTRPAGEYEWLVGGSSAELPLRLVTRLP